MNATAYTSTATRGFGRMPVNSLGNSIYQAPTGVRQSYAPTAKVFVTPSGEGRPMKYGDRIFVRLALGSKSVLEFEINSVNDYSELLGELRCQARGLDGLATLYVRNITRGWSQTRPIRLYADNRHPMRMREQSLRQPAARRMLCPWETH